MSLNSLEVWFFTGSQHLYGEETLRQVEANSRQVVEGLNASRGLPVRVVFRKVVTTPESILQACREANAADRCIGVICWMHTFSPAKMWIARPEGAGKAPGPPAHAVQSRSALGHDRHGLHEPQPGGPRRPRVRPHLHAAATSRAK